MSPDDQDLYQKRQRARARVMAILLGAFAITIAKMTVNR
jgi:hypothetical protein